MSVLEHLEKGSATHTAAEEPRGFIDCLGLKQLWLHTGTNCNLCCSSCFERSSPSNQRLEAINLGDVESFLQEAVALGASSFGFTGGEPFINPDVIQILEYALALRPCLVLSNGTHPLQRHLEELAILNRKNTNTLTIRISLDYPDSSRHDAGRGKGAFALALENMRELVAKGIAVTVARRSAVNEDDVLVSRMYREIFANNGLPETLPIVAFPDLQATEETPEITENCIRTYHTEESRARFMCAYSRMLVKKEGQIRVYACTLVDNDPDYDYGEKLRDAAQRRTLLRHKRCFSCFSSGVSCGG